MGGYNKTTWAFIGKLAPASASQGHQGKFDHNGFKIFLKEFS